MIRRRIRECALFVPIISAHTQARHEGYFRLEWDLADQRTHLMGRSRAFVVPVCLVMGRRFRAPAVLGSNQWPLPCEGSRVLTDQRYASRVPNCNKDLLSRDIT
jgi:hypothetical protein